MASVRFIRIVVGARVCLCGKEASSAWAVLGVSFWRRFRQRLLGARGPTALASALLGQWCRLAPGEGLTLSFAFWAE